jgi:2-keto-4-pentenoate hydratase
MSDIDAVAAGFLAAQLANEPYAAPSISAVLNIEDAHAVQRAFNSLRRSIDRLAGYKSAANAEALQRALGLSGPITGALFANGERAAGSRIRRDAYRTLLIETELGFRAARRINAPVKSIAELRAATTTCTPMIELADPGFGRTRMTGSDLIAANAASAGFIGGRAVSVGEIDVNEVRVHLRRDGETLHTARSGDLMNDQWQALMWLVNRIIELGYVIEAGHLLMTGALGAAHPGEPGKYTADFSALGVIGFEVV